eukprot:154099_1
MMSALDVISFLLVMITSNKADQPSLLNRQHNNNAWCFMYTANNAMQIDYWKPGNTAKLAIHLEDNDFFFRGKATGISQVMNWADKNNRELSGTTNVPGERDIMLNAMFAVKGFRYGFGLHDPLSKPMVKLTKYRRPRAPNANPVITIPTAIFLRDDDGVTHTVQQIKTLMAQPNFQAWIVHLEYYYREADPAADDWKHFSTITRNGIGADAKWFYLDPAFAITDVSVPEVWDCNPNVPGLRREGVGLLYNYQRDDCARATKYGLDGLRYMSSTYLGQGQTGINHAIAKIRSMFNGVTMRNPERTELLHNAFPMIWLKPLYNDVDDASTLKLFNNYFNYIKEPKIDEERKMKLDLGRTQLDQQRKYWPLTALRPLLQAEYQDMYQNGWGFFTTANDLNSGNDPADTRESKTCKLSDITHQPNSWSDNAIKRAILVSWRRRQGVCKKKWRRRQGIVNYFHVNDDILDHYNNFNILFLVMNGISLLIIVCICGVLFLCGIIVGWIFGNE